MQLLVLALLFLGLSIASALTANAPPKTEALNVGPLGSRHAGGDGIRRHLEGLLDLAAPDTSALANLNLPKVGLNNTCNNNMCEMLESALSCKALGFHLSKICARYMLGFLYACPVFPAPSELFFAPSVCLTELTSLLPAGTLQVQGPPQQATVNVLSGATELAPTHEGVVHDPVHASLGSLDSLGGDIDPSSFKFTNIKKYVYVCVRVRVRVCLSRSLLSTLTLILAVFTATTGTWRPTSPRTAAVGASNATSSRPTHSTTNARKSCCNS